MKDLLMHVIRNGDEPRLRESINSAGIRLKLQLKPLARKTSESGDLYPADSEWFVANTFGDLGVNREQTFADPPNFRTYVYWLIHNLYGSGHLRKLGICERCEKFFAKPADPERGISVEVPRKYKHCSAECYELQDQQNSGRRHINQDNRLKDWLAELQLKPTKTARQRQVIDSIVTSVFGGWKRFEKWKSEVEFASDDELLKSVSEDQRKLARARMKEKR